MPWRAVKRNGKALIVKADSGKVVGHSSSMADAKASVRARYMAEKSPEKMRNR